MSHNSNTPGQQNQGASKRRLVVKRKQGQNSTPHGHPQPNQFTVPRMGPVHHVPVAIGMPGHHIPPHQIPMPHQVPMMPMVPNFQHPTRPQIRSHRVYVDDEDVGFVIGGGGSTVKRIKGQTGALIKHFKKVDFPTPFSPITANRVPASSIN